MQRFGISLIVTYLASFVVAIDRDVWIAYFDFRSNEEVIIKASVKDGGDYDAPKVTEALVPENWGSGRYGFGWQLTATPDDNQKTKFENIDTSDKKILGISFHKPNPIVISPADQLYYRHNINAPSPLDRYPEGSIWEIKRVGGIVNYFGNCWTGKAISFNFELVPRKYFVLVYPKQGRDSLYILHGEIKPAEADTTEGGTEDLPKLRHRDRRNVEYAITKCNEVLPQKAFRDMGSIQDEWVGLIMRVHSLQNPLSVYCTNQTKIVYADWSIDSKGLKLNLEKSDV